MKKKSEKRQKRWGKVDGMSKLDMKSEDFESAGAGEYAAEAESINAVTALTGEVPREVDGVPLRRINLEALGVLQMIGHPVGQMVADVLNGVKSQEWEVTLPVLNELVWVLCEDEDEVLRVAVQCTPEDHRAATAAAFKFVRRFKRAGAAFDVIKAFYTDIIQLRASIFEAESPVEGESKKNG